MKLALISCVITALAALSLNAEAARFVRFEVNGTTSYGEVVGDKIHQLSELYFNAPERTGVTYDYDAVKLLLPLAPRDVSKICLLYTSPSPRDGLLSRMPSSA